MKQGWIKDIDHFAVHDGPGIRTSVYFQGCPLSCKWCHSPESQSARPQVLYASSRCVSCGACIAACPRGLHRPANTAHAFDREGCQACGECVKNCRAGALSMSGRYMTLEELSEEVLSDKVFFSNSGGGVTLSGGEILLQADFVYSLLEILKAQQVHTIVETSGYGSQKGLLKLASVTDQFYYDCKLLDAGAFRWYTGGDVQVVLGNLEALRACTDQITLRIPLIPNITDTAENVKNGYQLAERLQIQCVHLLPYNYSAGAKYEWIGREYTLMDISPREGVLDELLALAPPSLDVQVIR